MLEVINEGHLVMKRLGLVSAVIVAVAGLVAFGIWRHHVNPPRFEVQVRPRAVMSKSECRSLKIPGFPESSGLCFGAGWGASYAATVTNSGGRGAWVESCRIEAIDRSGHGILWTEVPSGRVVAGNGLPVGYLDPGKSHTFEWFIRVDPKRVARYTGTCTYTESRGGIL
jgi:hypothetical protein